MLWEIPHINPGTVICIGGGPSLTPEQVALTRGNYTIAVNNAFELAPWADILYGCDAKWWNWYWDKNSQGGPGIKDFAGLKVGLAWDGRTNDYYDGWKSIKHDIKQLSSRGVDHLEIRDPSGLRTGENSGYQAMNLAVQLGAKKIILIGYDMSTNGQSHWHGEHPSNVRPPVESFIPHFESFNAEKYGVEIINCTPDSKLIAFPMMELEVALG